MWEWCADTYQPNYEGAPTDGSAWIAAGVPAGSPFRVIRGGSWDYWPGFCRSAIRYWWDPVDGYIDLGFRPALGPRDR